MAPYNPVLLPLLHFFSFSLFFSSFVSFSPFQYLCLATYFSASSSSFSLFVYIPHSFDSGSLFPLSPPIIYFILPQNPSIPLHFFLLSHYIFPLIFPCSIPPSGWHSSLSFISLFSLFAFPFDLPFISFLP